MSDNAAALRRMLKFRHHLTIRHLRLIEAIGREKSVSRCAKVLHTSQSAVSRGLSELEALLGASLFERTTRRVDPTLLGRNLIQHAEHILAELDRAEADFDAIAKGVRSTLDVGVMGAFSPALLAQAIQRVSEQAPTLTIRLRSNVAEGLVPDLAQGHCELILTHFDIRQFGHEDLVVDELYRDSVHVVAAPNHPLARRKALEWSDLATERWVFTPVETSTRRIVERNLLTHATGRSLAIVESMEVHFILALVREAGMLTALPMRLADWLEHELGLVKRLPVRDPVSEWEVCVARLHGREASAAATLFISCLKAVCAGASAAAARSTPAASRTRAKPATHSVRGSKTSQP